MLKSFSAGVSSQRFLWPVGGGLASVQPSKIEGQSRDTECRPVPEEAPTGRHQWSSYQIATDTPPRSRGAMRPSFAKNVRPENRGRGECRAPDAPAASCALLVASMHTSIHSEPPENTRHSRTQWFTAYTALLCPQNLPECANGRFSHNRPSLDLSP